MQNSYVEKNEKKEKELAQENVPIFKHTLTRCMCFGIIKNRAYLQLIYYLKREKFEMFVLIYRIYCEPCKSN